MFFQGQGNVHKTTRDLVRRSTESMVRTSPSGLPVGIPAAAPRPIAFPKPQSVQVRIDRIDYIDFVNLIQLKLAARRYQDFADVVSLIRVHNLDESYQTRLHPAVRHDFIECLEENRREDEYEARDV